MEQTFSIIFSKYYQIIARTMPIIFSKHCHNIGRTIHPCILLAISKYGRIFLNILSDRSLNMVRLSPKHILRTFSKYGANIPPEYSQNILKIWSKLPPGNPQDIFIIWFEYCQSYSHNILKIYGANIHPNILI